MPVPVTNCQRSASWFTARTGGLRTCASGSRRVKARGVRCDRGEEKKKLGLTPPEQVYVTENERACVLGTRLDANAAPWDACSTSHGVTPAPCSDSPLKP